MSRCGSAATARATSAKPTNALSSRSVWFQARRCRQWLWRTDSTRTRAQTRRRVAVVYGVLRYQLGRALDEPFEGMLLPSARSAEVWQDDRLAQRGQAGAHPGERGEELGPVPRKNSHRVPTAVPSTSTLARDPVSPLIEHHIGPAPRADHHRSVAGCSRRASREENAHVDPLDQVVLDEGAVPVPPSGQAARICSSRSTRNAISGSPTTYGGIQ